MSPKDKSFILEFCNLKHDNINKDIDSIKKNVEEMKKKEKEQHEEIKKIIIDLTREVRTSNVNLKDKIILNHKTTGSQIDDLNNFDKNLRGNGNPGIWESVRSIRRNIKIMMWIIIIMSILLLGGDYRGISIDSIRDRFGFKNKEIKITEPISKQIKSQEFKKSKKIKIISKIITPYK